MIRASGTATRILPAAPLALFFLFAYVLPVAILTAISFKPDLRASGWTFGNYAGFLGDWFNLSILLDTLWLGIQATALTLLIAYPLSLLYMRAGPRLRALLVFLILLPLLTNTVVRTFAWMAILGRNGLIDTLVQTIGLTTEPLRLLYSRTGLVVALAQIYLPMMALPLNNSLARIDPNLLRAAEGLGASRAYVFGTVILPLSLPGAVAGCLLVFAGSTTAFITQTLVGGGRQIFMPLFIYQQALGVQRWAFAAAASIAFALTVMLIVYAFNRFARARLRGVDA
jgi:putative spermidine/putrescine transport system permease protein